MRAFFACGVIVFAGIACPCYGKDNSGSFPSSGGSWQQYKAPNNTVPDYKTPQYKPAPSGPPALPTKPIEFNPKPIEIPGLQKYKKFELPETYDITPTYDYSTGPDYLKKFDGWAAYLDHKNGGLAGCEFYRAAVDRWSFLLPLQHYVKYHVSQSGEHEFRAHVPRTPHPKGAPVVFIGSLSFQLVAQDARNYVASPATRQKMVKAIKANPVMVVKWTEGDGTRWEDRYPLKGALDSFNHLAQICPFVDPACPTGDCAVVKSSCAKTDCAAENLRPAQVGVTKPRASGGGR